MTPMRSVRSINGRWPTRNAGSVLIDNGYLIYILVLFIFKWQIFHVIVRLASDSRPLIWETKGDHPFRQSPFYFSTGNRQISRTCKNTIFLPSCSLRSWGFNNRGNNLSIYQITYSLHGQMPYRVTDGPVLIVVKRVQAILQPVFVSCWRADGWLFAFAVESWSVMDWVFRGNVVVLWRQKFSYIMFGWRAYLGKSVLLFFVFGSQGLWLLGV